MKVQVHLPRESEAEVTYDTRTRTLTIVPVFHRTQGRTEIGYVEVVGNKGFVAKSVLEVSGKDGSLYAADVRTVVPDFDKLPAGAQAPAAEVAEA